MQNLRDAFPADGRAVDRVCGCMHAFRSAWHVCQIKPRPSCGRAIVGFSGTQIGREKAWCLRSLQVLCQGGCLRRASSRAQVRFKTLETEMLCNTVLHFGAQTPAALRKEALRVNVVAPLALTKARRRSDFACVRVGVSACSSLGLRRPCFLDYMAVVSFTLEHRWRR